MNNKIRVARHLLELNIVWTLALSFAVVETMTYFSGIAMFDPRAGYVSMLDALLAGRFPNWQALDVLTVMLMLWFSALKAANAPIPELFEKPRPLRTIKFSYSVLYVIITSLFILRIVLGHPTSVTEVIFSVLIGIGFALIEHYSSPYLGSEKLPYWVIWILATFLSAAHLLSDEGFSRVALYDLGLVKDLGLMTLLFVLASILYPSVDILLHNIKMWTLFIAVAIILLAAFVVYIELDFPYSGGGTAYCIGILQVRGLQTTEDNIRQLQSFMHNHVLLRTCFSLFCGVVAPYVLYVIMSASGNKRLRQKKAQ